ncbi:hypothetical protein CCIPSID_3090 [Campylobacter coli IPSID-1]|nr:hypothetical protein CCIPSID_3090 [Campylobacter coli IPSID-1]
MVFTFKVILDNIQELRKAKRCILVLIKALLSKMVQSLR